jgi:hypothetical protein
MPLSRTELGIGSGISLFDRLVHFTFVGELLVILHSVDYVFGSDYGVPVLDMLRFHVPSPRRSCADRKRVNQRQVPSVGKESDVPTSGRVHSFEDGITR